MNTLAALFTNPMDITGSTYLMMYPLSVAAVVIYKTVRIPKLKGLLSSIIKTSLLVILCEAGLTALGWAYLKYLH